MQNHPNGRAKKRRRYPGFRPCLNHCTLSEMFKNPIPELCPTCFRMTAKHQVQLVALNYCSVQLLRQRLHELEEETDDLRNFVKKIIETGG